MPTPTTNPPTDEWLAIYGRLSANMPPNCTAAWKADFLNLGATLYAFGATTLASGVGLANGATPGLGNNSAAVLAQLQQYGSQGCSIAAIAKNTGMTEPTITRAITVLKGKGLANEIAGGLYVAVGADNVQGIATGSKAPAKRGRKPRAAQGQRAGAAA